ncbi:MAG TPA: serine hydrolase [Actinomycetota bacterium]|nr:serine hydrolase [Actinomycetota bacterium]
MKTPPPRLKVRPLPADIQRLVRREMARTKTPGVAVGMLLEGRAYGQGFGVTNVAMPAPVDTHTLFQIGSTGKTFTATAIMRLVEQGEIDLDAPVRRYLRDFKLRDADVQRRVTVRHLLTHTGGWAGDIFPDTGRGDDALARAVAVLRKVPQLTPLGSTWHYNNAGFYVAGRILEKVTGMSYERAITTLVLEPLGMTNSFFLAEELLPHRVATGHVEKHGKQIPQPWWGLRSVAPAGGLVSDVIDQLRWAEFNLGDGRAPNGARILKRSTMRFMQTPRAPAGGLAESVGISWLLDHIGETETVSHGGTTIGQLSSFTMVPSRRLAITTMSNSTSGRSLNRAVVAHVLERYAKVTRVPPTLKETTADELIRYQGRYVDGFKQVQISLRPVGRRLRGTLTALAASEENGSLPIIRLALTGPDRAVHDGDIYAGLRAEFLRNDAGRLQWLRLGGRLYRRVSATPAEDTKAKKRQARR